MVNIIYNALIIKNILLIKNIMIFTLKIVLLSEKEIKNEKIKKWIKRKNSENDENIDWEEEEEFQMKII